MPVPERYGSVVARRARGENAPEPIVSRRKRARERCITVDAGEARGMQRASRDEPRSVRRQRHVGSDRAAVSRAIGRVSVRTGDAPHPAPRRSSSSTPDLDGDPRRPWADGRRRRRSRRRNRFERRDAENRRNARRRRAGMMIVRASSACALFSRGGWFRVHCATRTPRG